MVRRKPGRMSRLGDQVFDETDRELADEEVGILLRTSIDWEGLRPQVTNAAVYDQLIAVVQESTRKNESIAQLRGRLQQLGQEGLKLVKKVIGLIT